MMLKATSRAWCIAINAVIWFGISQVNHNLMALILACASLSVLLVSMAAAFFTLRGIEIVRRPFDQLHVGTLANLPLECRNLKRHRRQTIVIIEKLLFAQNRTVSSVVATLEPGESRIVNRAVMPSARGAFMLDKIVIRSADPAGVYCLEKTVILPEAIVVYPSVEPLENLDLSEGSSLSTSLTSNPTNAAGYSQDFYGVREYHPSDGMRFIHWKSTARHNKLMVREFERRSQLTVAILIDGVGGTATPEAPALHLEATLIAAASICNYLSRKTCNLALGIGGERLMLLPPSPVEENWREAMMMMATMESGDIPLTDVIESMVAQLPARSIIYCFSLNESESLYNELAMLAGRGMDLSWYHASKTAFKAKLHHPQNTEGLETGRGLSPRRMSPALSMAQMIQ
jgi:uncharacterized protein (DUF58 family)